MAETALTCKELVELVTDYLEGALPAAERARFDRHLDGCQGCRNYLYQMRQTIRLTGRLTEASISPEAQEKLQTVFREWKGG